MHFPYLGKELVDPGVHEPLLVSLRSRSQHLVGHGGQNGFLAPLLFLQHRGGMTFIPLFLDGRGLGGRGV